MAIHDYVIDNDVGANLRADINNALAAAVTQNSSATEPTTTYAHMVWADTANDILKIRDAANTGWVSVSTLSTGAPVAGGGGGSTDYLPQEFLFAYKNIAGPTTIQKATTPIAAEGTVYVAGDIFAVPFNTSTYAGCFICVALKGFTFSFTKDTVGHAWNEELFLLTPAAFYCKLLNYTTLPTYEQVVPTTVTLDVSGRLILFSGATYGKAGTESQGGGVVGIGDPVHANYAVYCLSPPWLWKTDREAGIAYGINDRRGYPMGAAAPREFGDSFNSIILDKLSTNFSYSKGINLFNEISSVAQSQAAFMIPNGESFEASVFLTKFLTAPNAEDPVYNINLNTTRPGRDTKILDTSPVDVNSIRIGTWKAGNILEVQVS